MYCDKEYIKLTSNKAYSHIMGKVALSMKRSDISPCIPIQIKDDTGKITEDRRPAMKEMRKTFAGVSVKLDRNG